MKRYIKASITSGLVGIWWIKDGTVLADAFTLDQGYNDGSYINYDEFKNHTTEWPRIVNECFPDESASIISKGYKSLDRGRVIYNIRTQCYEIICGDSVYTDADLRRLIIDAFDLFDCRYEFVNLGHHYHKAELTGNPVLDQFEYGI